VVASDNTTSTTTATCNYAAGAGPATGYDADAHPLLTRTVTGSDCSGGTTVRTVSPHYDARGLVDSLTQVLHPPTGSDITRTESFSHADDAQLTAATHDGRSTTYAYDPVGSGRLTTMTDWRARVSSFTYLASGKLRTQALGGVATATLASLPDGSTASLAWARSTDGATVRSDAAMGYDVGGLQSSEVVSVLQPQGSAKSPGGQGSFGFDLAGRLTSWTSPFGGATTTYTLDDGANVTAEASASTTSSSYTNGRLATRSGPATSTSFEYTALGEEKTRSDATATAYDPAGHVASRTPPPVSPLPAVPVGYVYDPASGALVSRTEAAQTTLYFFWGAGRSLAEETDATGATKVRYLVDAHQRPLGQESYVSPGTGNPVWTWLLTDAAGNVATHLDDSGTVTQQVSYTPYGKLDPNGSDRRADATEPSTLGFGAAMVDSSTSQVCQPSRNSLTLPSRNSLARREADVYSMASPSRWAPGCRRACSSLDRTVALKRPRSRPTTTVLVPRRSVTSQQRPGRSPSWSSCSTSTLIGSREPLAARDGRHAGEQ